MLARCPTCRNTFSTDHAGRQNCPVCGKPLVVPEQGAPSTPPPQAELVPPAEPEGTPWERRAELGFIAAWVQTMQMALFEPGKLFASARLDHGAAQLGFAVLTTSIFGVIGQILDRLTTARFQPLFDRVLAQSEAPAWLLKAIHNQNTPTTAATFIGLLIVFPLFAVIFIYLNAAVTHLFALVLGQSKRGFPATFAACAYACAPLVLSAVPACGGLVGVIWLIVLTGVGLKITHGIKPAGAAAAVLLPYVVLCCFGCVSLAVAGAALRGMLSGSAP